MLQKPARVGTVILFLIGFVPYPLCFGGMIVCRCVIYYMILVLWLVLTSNVFLLLELIRCVSEECAWVEALPVMFRPGCLKIAESFGEDQQIGSYFRFQTPFQLLKLGNHISGRERSLFYLSRNSFHPEAHTMGASETKAEGSFTMFHVWNRSVSSSISM